MNPTEPTLDEELEARQARYEDIMAEMQQYFPALYQHTIGAKITNLCGVKFCICEECKRGK